MEEEMEEVQVLNNLISNLKFLINNNILAGNERMFKTIDSDYVKKIAEKQMSGDDKRILNKHTELFAQKMEEYRVKILQLQLLIKDDEEINKIKLRNRNKEGISRSINEGKWGYRFLKEGLSDDKKKEIERTVDIMSKSNTNNNPISITYEDIIKFMKRIPSDTDGKSKNNPEDIELRRESIRYANVYQKRIKPIMDTGKTREEADMIRLEKIVSEYIIPHKKTNDQKVIEDLLDHEYLSDYMLKTQSLIDEFDEVGR